MKYNRIIRLYTNAVTLAVFLLTALFFHACQSKSKQAAKRSFSYEAFKDSLRRDTVPVKYDTSNVFDNPSFTPGIDSLEPLLEKVDTLWQHELALIEQMDSMISHLKKGVTYTPEEKKILRENVRMLDSFLHHRDSVPPPACREKECLLYAEVIKSTQTLYLYINGEIKDSFKVSTGIKKYETPEMSVRPAGPLFTKYTSRKFPGGDYKGLGNMPYAVFVRGGYAIHGTTPGNFSKLGNRASHGCIRLHPDNGRIFYELVKTIGLEHTWVRVREHPEIIEE